MEKHFEQVHKKFARIVTSKNFHKKLIKYFKIKYDGLQFLTNVKFYKYEIESYPAVAGIKYKICFIFTYSKNSSTFFENELDAFVDEFDQPTILFLISQWLLPPRKTA